MAMRKPLRKSTKILTKVDGDAKILNKKTSKANPAKKELYTLPR
jgi:hypothetical protein